MVVERRGPWRGGSGLGARGKPAHFAFHVLGEAVDDFFPIDFASFDNGIGDAFGRMTAQAVHEFFVIEHPFLK